MAKNGESPQNELIKTIWMNCNKTTGKNDSLWSRVHKMVHVLGQAQMQTDTCKMKPDSVPVGVDCTLSPVLPASVTVQSRSEFCAAVAAAATANSTATVPTSNGLVKRLVCSPDLPVYPVRTSRPASEEVNSTETSTVSKPSTQDMLQKLYQCTICSESFSQKTSLNAHIKTHNKEGEDPYQCNFCGKTFAVPARLTRHYRTHTGEKPYQCEYCNKSFSVKENLSVHKRIHTKERPYKCEVCARAFEHSGKLHRHMRIHTGERPHKCNYCSKTFIQSGQLVIHLRTHTGEKPYVCKCCNKGFTCSKQLKVHTRTHTGEKPYACDICGKSFGYNHVLKLHQVAHFGEKVYKCTICKETFTSKKSMESHIKMSHSDSNTPRNGTESESPSSSSTSDKENKVEIPTDMSYPRSSSGSSPNTPASLDESRQVSLSPVYENYSQSPNRNSYLSYPQPSTVHHQGLNAALLAAAAAAAQNEQMHLNYQNESSYHYPSKFQIPAAATASGARFYPAASPSSFSDSSRSSPSPKLEIVEPTGDESALYVLPDYDRLRYRESNLVSPTNSSSVIIQVPYGEHTTPSSSSSTSPIPMSPDVVDLPSIKEERNLPPRKRTKMILESMEKDRIEDTNFRYSSVIQYAKASQIA